MQLALDGISKKVGAQTWLYDMSLALQSNAVTVLLGATQAGKTSLMRIMAGLDVPTQGRVLVDGKDVTGTPVRDRNVAMVYQQFINYPSMKVFDNIASPLKLRGEKNIDARVRELASRLHIEMFLDRLPAELSGGQQQRVALARALAKGAPLMLLDEPLVNLDYKLREELREELTQLFAAGQSTVVYATTEPGEALPRDLQVDQFLLLAEEVDLFHVGRQQQLATKKFGVTPELLLRVALAGDRQEDAIDVAQGVDDHRLTAGRRGELPLHIGQIYEQRKDYQKLKQHLGEYLKGWATKGGIDRQIIAEVKLGDIGTAEVERVSTEVTEAAIDKTLDILRKQRRTFQQRAAAEGAAEGDRVTIDFEGKIDGVPFEGGKAEGFQFIIGEGQMLEQFDAAVRGMKAGESKTFPLQFPADYHGKDVAGKEADFLVTMKKVEAQHLPELLDEAQEALGLGAQRRRRGGLGGGRAGGLAGRRLRRPPAE